MHPTRIFFEKRGRVIYISHLDLMRAFTRAVRRAALPVWYTEGFNPHPYLAFPLPLPLGQEGLREACDVRLLETVPHNEVCARLNAVLPEGLRALAVHEPWDKPGDIAAAEYRITVQGDIAQAEALLQAGNLTAKKMGKKGHRKVEKEVELMPMIKRCVFDGDVFACTLAAGSTVNLNPTLLLNALGLEAAHITRVRLLKHDDSAWA
ncbi:MAG: TIGR03936 family radical SAM-associated protein [Oscillospiraceae bacterium]|nr:TIGR03936 family radical SAM-associated protein [Oscillospiraceae bacterium]